MTGIATGLALEGRIVYTYSIGNFPTLRCLEQLRNDACYHGANVNVVSIGGGFSYGALGFSHHATEDLSILRSLPGMTVMAPCDTWEVEEATSALSQKSGVGYLRLDKSSAPLKPKEGEVFHIGKSRCVREGNDLTFVVAGGILEEVLKASELLKAEGIEARILSMHTIKPLDTEALFEAVRTSEGIVTVEEHTIEGGLGGAVAESCLEAGVVPRFFYRFGLRQGFSSLIGSQAYMRRLYGLDAEAIAKRVKELVSERDAQKIHRLERFPNAQENF